MARLKVQTSKQKVNTKKQELKAPDEVMTQLQRLSDHLSKHMKLYVGGLVAVCLLALAINLIVDYYSSKSIEESAAVFAATSAVQATVGEYADDEKLVSLQPIPEDQKTEPDFATAEERWAAALTAIEEARGKAGDLAPLVSALEGRVQLAVGKPGEAATAFSVYIDEAEEGDSLLPLVLENRGRAAEAQGNLSEAADYYEKLAGMSDLYYKVRGELLLGDLYNPGHGQGEGRSAEKAQEHYKAALEALTPGEGKVLTSALRGLRGEIARRSAQVAL